MWTIAKFSFVCFSLLLMRQSSVYACKPILLGRDDTVEKMVQRAEQIVIATVEDVQPSKIGGFEKANKYDYKMKITMTLKGEPKLKKLNLKAFDAPEMSGSKISVGIDCENHGGFKKGAEYLIFLNSVNSKAFQPISGENDPWLLEVKNQVEVLKSK